MIDPCAKVAATPLGFPSFVFARQPNVVPQSRDNVGLGTEPRWGSEMSKLKARASRPCESCNQHTGETPVPLPPEHQGCDQSGIVGTAQGCFRTPCPKPLSRGIPELELQLRLLVNARVQPERSAVPGVFFVVQWTVSQFHAGQNSGRL